MNIILCLDDRNGMLFAGRRQSRDRKVTEDIGRMVKEAGAKLWISPFSARLFEESSFQPEIDEAFMEKAEPEDYCLVENLPLAAYEEEITSLIVYRWNRHYPADFRLDLDLNEWQLQSRSDFVGFSHECITKEEYIR